MAQIQEGGSGCQVPVNGHHPDRHLYQLLLRQLALFRAVADTGGHQVPMQGQDAERNHRLPEGGHHHAQYRPPARCTAVWSGAGYRQLNAGKTSLSVNEKVATRLKRGSRLV